jgi:hypothetical protein
LDRLQQSDPIFHMRVDVMRPTYNFEPKYRVVALTREDWTSGNGTPPSIQGVIIHKTIMLATCILTAY